MNEAMWVLVLSPESTSTKAGVFIQAGSRTIQVNAALTARTISSEWTCSLPHADSELERFRGLPAMAQVEFRAERIREALATAGYNQLPFAAAGGRGGLLPPMECGTWLVNDAMIEQLRWHGVASTPATWEPCWH